MRRFAQLDVFASEGISGNPLAVVIDGDGLTDDEMASFAHWTNLSETTFLLPPTDPAADYRVRIFTPAEELPFAGHPTLGSARAWLLGGGEATDGRIVQQCGVGNVAVRVDGERLAFAAPGLLRSGPPTPEVLGSLLGALSLDPDEVLGAEWIDNGPGWLGLLLADADRVLAVDGRLDRVDASVKVGLAAVTGGAGPDGDGVDLVVRALFRDGEGVTREDPVTGSLNASLAQWLIGAGHLTAPYVAAQGHRLGRRGRVHVDAADGELWIGGRADVVIDGTVTI